MRTPAKLAGFAGILAIVFAVSYAIGTAVGPVGQPSDDHHDAPATTIEVPADEHEGHDDASVVGHED